MDKTKNVTIGTRNFQIRKFGARQGAFLAIKVQGLVGPIIEQIDFNKIMSAKKIQDIKLDDIHLGRAMQELGKLSEDDFNYLHDKSLSVVGEFLQGNPNPVPVLHENGTYGVGGLDEDPMVVMALIVHSLLFNLQGFFQSNALSSIVGKFSTTSLQPS